MKIVIEIPEEVKIAFDNAESNDLKGCYYDHGGVIGNAIKNGTPLPKGHGRLIDADKLQNKLFEMGCYQGKPCLGTEIISRMKTIIEADKEAENE